MFEPSILASSLPQAIAGLPWAAHAAAALVLIAGLVLWATGRHVVRHVIAFVLGSIGAIVGIVAFSSLDLASAASPLVGALAGAVVGLLSGFLLHRATAAATFAVVFGLGTAIVACAGLHFIDRSAMAKSPSSDSLSTTTALAVNSSPPNSIPLAETETRSRTRFAPDQARWTTTRRAARAFASSASDSIRMAWAEASPKLRWIAIGTAALGAIVGVLLGMKMPNWAASPASALVGAALWLPAAAWLICAVDAPGRSFLSSSPPAWAIAWLAAAAAGMAMQWLVVAGPSLRAPSADRAS